MRKVWNAARIALLISFIIFSNAKPLFAGKFDVAKLTNGWTTLSEDWDYYKNALLTPFDFYPQMKISYGQKVQLPHAFEEGVYYATFHYRASGLVPNKSYATELYGSVASCFRLWCNGKLMATAGFLSSEMTSAVAGESCEPIDLISDQNGNLDILIQVADFESAKKGILKPIKITEKNNAATLFHLHYFFNTLILFFLFAHILYNLTLLFLMFKRQRSVILILLCSALAASITLTGFSITQKVFSNFPFWLHKRMPIALLTLDSFLLTLYEMNMLKEPVKRIAPTAILSAASFILDIATTERFFQSAKELLAAIPIICAMFSISFQSQFMYIKTPGEEKNATRTPFLIKARSACMFFILAVSIAEFLVLPQKSTLIHRYSYFKISVFLFGIMQTLIYAFNRNWLISRVNLYTEYLTKDNETLAKFVPDHTLKVMGASDITKIITGESRVIDALIVCVQIKHYNQLSETIERKELYSITLEFYQSISPIIVDSGGFVAKHTNGGFIAIFQEKSSDAIICAARIQKKIRDIRRTLRKTRRSDIGAGVSIHSGKVAIGTMGTSYRIDTAVISEDVNIAVAVANQTSKMNSNILITEEAMPYCRSFIDYMYEGHFFILNGKQILVYSAQPIIKRETAYEETLEAIEEEDEI